LDRPAATRVLTTLDELLRPGGCALLVVDVQRDFVHPDGWSARRAPGAASLRRVIPVINALVAAARAAAVPVCYITMEHGRAVDAPNYQARYLARGMGEEILCVAGGWGAALDDELTPPRPDDITIVRHSYDGFAGTDLDARLRARKVDVVVAAGVVTNLCVQTTVQHAFALGYYVVVVEDGTAAVDPDIQAMTLDNFRRYFGPVVPAGVVNEHWAESGR
jgi:ureidoacrylate peracid hydrolase